MHVVSKLCSLCVKRIMLSQQAFIRSFFFYQNDFRSGVKILIHFEYFKLINFILTSYTCLNSRAVSIGIKAYRPILI